MRTIETINPNRFLFDLDSNIERFLNPASKSINKSSKGHYELATKDDFYHLALEVPGFKKEDLKVELEQNKLKVSGTRNGTLDPEKKIEVEETFTIPKDILQDQIQVSLTDGILKVDIPRDVALTQSRILEISN